jgi:hypothetical protein
MCRNHSHVATNMAIQFTGQDGLNIALVEVDQDLTVESLSGPTLMYRSGATLLILRPPTGVEYCLRCRVTAALVALLSTAGDEDPDPLGTIALELLKSLSES